MDRRSWPWRKKSSEKTVTGTDHTCIANSAVSQGDQEASKKIKYVQISEETYAQLTESEEQVALLNEKLSSAYSEMTTKDNLVKQHTKVAEDAVSGWEKAEAEALALKQQLESVTLAKLAAEERATHLDGALKECMRQIRLIREESEEKLHEVVLNKAKQLEQVKFEFEAKISDLEQELLQASAENTALARSFQERSNILMEISEEKSQADTEIEILKNNIHSFEREVSSLKYELHIASKELEIRNEEKNMCMRSAEVANKQQLESVKKISKLESECQRLRGLVRKKLPGPAALAQMKLEVENLGRDYGESRLKRSSTKNSSPRVSTATEFSLDHSVQECHKETEFLTVRLLAMDEEIKMLKEALAKRNSELQSSRNMCAKTASKLHSLEAHMQSLNQRKSLQKSSIEMPIEGYLSQNTSNPPSLTSMSEDGIDDEASCAESWATALISELSHFKKGKSDSKGNKADNSKELELMDDFLEMERMACRSTESNGTIHLTENGNDRRVDICESNHQTEHEPSLDSLAKRAAPSAELSDLQLESDRKQPSLSELQARIGMIFESQAKNAVSLEVEKTVDSVISSIPDSKPCAGTNNIKSDLANAVSKIHGIVEALGKEAVEIQKEKYPDPDGLSQKIEEFSLCINKVLCGQLGLGDFICDLSHVLATVAELFLNVLSDKANEGESSSVDCVDKVTLLENKVNVHDQSIKRLSSESILVSHSSLDPEILQEGTSDLSFESKSTLCKCLRQELAQLKMEKENIAMDLDQCSENLEKTKTQLVESEQLLAELKLELASSQKSNSLAETQLKCMAESYKSLELRSQELEIEINILRTKAETLDNELQEEKCSHQDAIAKCKDLQEQIQRNKEASLCSLSSAADVDINTKQEKDIAAAAEKLAQCQETIFLLGRQLKAMRSPTELTGSPSSYSERPETNDGFLEDEPSPGVSYVQAMHGSPGLQQAEVEKFASNAHRMGDESPLNAYSAPLNPSDNETQIPRSPISSKRQKHRPSRSSSCAPPTDKQSHGFSRFFSKGKSSH